jgi:hypothetical protein
VAAVSGAAIEGGVGQAGRGRRSRQAIVWASLSILVTVGSIVFVVRWMKPSEMLAVLAHGQPAGLAVGFGLFALANLFKSERLRRLTPEAAGTGSVPHFSMVCVYNLVSALMPAGIGEASYPAMLRMRRGGSVAAGVSAVVVTRLMDLAVVAGCAVAALWAASAHRVPNRALMTAVFLGALVAAIAGTSRARGSRLARRAWGRLTGGLDEASAAQPLRVAGAAWRSRTVMIALTASFWAAGFAASWSVVMALGLPLDFAQLVEGNSLALLMSALPFRGALGFGTQHVGWVAGLAVFGWSRGEALDVAIPIHLVTAAFTIALGAAGWALGLTRHLPPIERQ